MGGAFITISLGVMEHSDGTSRNIVQDLLEKKLAQMV